MASPHQSPIVHQLPEYERDGYPPSYEYRLPALLEPEQLAALHPWLQEVAGLAPDEARQRLQARWATLRGDGLCQLREYLLECDVLSLVLTGARAWLLLVHENQGFNLVGPPLNKEAISQRLSEWHLDDHAMLNEFLVNFGGLQEDFVPGGGGFIADEKWDGVTEPWMEGLEGGADWKGCLMFFHSRGGHYLLMHPSGRVGWWVGDEKRMRDAYDDLDTCLIDFLRYRDAPWPFDPYEPRFDFPRIVG